MDKLFNNPKYSDFQFINNQTNEILYCHKAILSEMNKYLDAYIYNLGNKQNENMHVENDEWQETKDIMEWIYKHKLDFDNIINYIELYILADRWNQMDLINEIKEYLKNKSFTIELFNYIKSSNIAELIQIMSSKIDLVILEDIFHIVKLSFIKDKNKANYIELWLKNIKEYDNVLGYLNNLNCKLDVRSIGVSSNDKYEYISVNLQKLISIKDDIKIANKINKMFGKRIELYIENVTLFEEIPIEIYYYDADKASISEKHIFGKLDIDLIKSILNEAVEFFKNKRLDTKPEDLDICITKSSCNQKIFIDIAL